MSPLERRLLRLTWIVSLFAVAGAVFGMLPDGVDVYTHSFKHDTNTFDHTRHAGGWSLIVWAIAQLLAGKWVRERPNRAAGARWFVAELMIYLTIGIAWLFENFTLSPEHLEWPAHVTAACVGATTLLVFVALPAVLVVSRRSSPSEAPTARVV